jgi:hypothetical protein
MSKHIILFLFCIGLSGLWSGCTKTGTPGPAGTTGPQGVVGPAGADGTVIYSGPTAPDAGTGNVGDFYLDLTSDVLYGPKSASGWGSGFSLKGATGATGAAGSQIFNGSGVPASSLGMTGDYYLDKTNFLLYGPKLAAGWGVPITLQGPAGSANVEYTPWFDPLIYTKDTLSGVVRLYSDQAVPAISQSIVDNGTVITFGQLDGYEPTIWPTNQVAQMPITVAFFATPTVFDLDTWSALITPGNVRIQMVSTTNYGLIADSHLFRCIIIPGGVSIPAGIGFEEALRYLRVRSNE